MLGTRILTLQALAALDEVLYHHMQFLHVERLCQEGISTTLQAFQAVGDLSLGGQHDDRYVSDVEVGLHHAQHGHAVHFRHHNIAHHDIVLIGQHFLQTLASVGADAKLIVTAQFCGDILGYLQVIIDNQHPALG